MRPLDLTRVDELLGRLSGAYAPDRYPLTQELASWVTPLVAEVRALRANLDAALGIHRDYVDRTAPLVGAMQPVTDPSGDVLYIHNHEGSGYRCGHVEWWNEAVHGPINEQGCDACESAPDGTWRPLYIREAVTR